MEQIFEQRRVVEQRQVEEQRRVEEQRLVEEQRRIEEQQKPTKKIEFEILLIKLNVKIKELIAKEASGYVYYEEAAGAAQVLDASLEDAKKAYFADNTLTLPEFKERCKLAIDEAEVVFKQHRGWHQLNPVLRGFLGVLAILTFIPALIVRATVKDGYLGTFFYTPETDSSKQLQSFTDAMKMEGMLG